MGVMTCGRGDCPEIMCNQMMLGWYICSDCLHELTLYKETWPKEISRADMKRRIEAFMSSPVGTYLIVDRDEEFNKHIR